MFVDLTSDLGASPNNNMIQTVTLTMTALMILLALPLKEEENVPLGKKLWWKCSNLVRKTKKCIRNIFFFQVNLVHPMMIVLKPVTRINAVLGFEYDNLL